MPPEPRPQEPKPSPALTGRRAFLVALAGAGLWLGYSLVRSKRANAPDAPQQPAAEMPASYREVWRAAESHLGAERAASLAVLAADLLPPQALDDGSEMITPDFAQTSAAAEWQALQRAWEADPDRLDDARVLLDHLASAAGAAWKDLAAERRAELLQAYFEAFARATAEGKAAEARAPDAPAELGFNLVLLRETLEAGFWEQPGLRAWMQARACETGGAAPAG